MIGTSIELVVYLYEGYWVTPYIGRHVSRSTMVKETKRSPVLTRLLKGGGQT